jgi:O-antigen/teichoic acid export membrane protein
VSQLVNLLLTPLYVMYLSPADQGVLVLLILFSTVAKIVFRLGLDGGFLRLYYEENSDADRRGLVFTIAGFAALLASVLFGAVLLAAPALGGLVLGEGVPLRARYVSLAAADIYLGTFAFVPLALLRIQDRPVQFALLNLGRNLANTVLKVAFLVSGFGVTGVLWSDLLATGAWAVALAPTLVANASPLFRPERLKDALRFGLPKTPHGLMLQLLNLGDRKLLEIFRDLASVGIYDKGYVLGAGVKFALSAFEPAWQPFVYAQIGKPDAPATLARIVTYAWAAFVGLGLLVAVFGRELLIALTFTNPAFWAGAPVVPVVTLAYLLHGAFLLTSIGIGISKDTRLFPLITAAAAVTNIAANLLLIPRFGMLGAAWATVLAYAVMAGIGFVLSRRLYPIPFEAGRLARVSAAALLCFLLSRLAPEPLPWSLLKLVALAAFPALLLASGFLNQSERLWLRTSTGRRA